MSRCVQICEFGFLERTCTMNQLKTSQSQLVEENNVKTKFCIEMFFQEKKKNSERKRKYWPLPLNVKTTERVQASILSTSVCCFSVYICRR